MLCKLLDTFVKHVKTYKSIFIAWPTGVTIKKIRIGTLLQIGLSIDFSGGLIDQLEISRYSLIVFTRDQLQAVANQLDDTPLNFAIEIFGFYGVGEALETVNAGDQHIL